jgi:hypothetical protein
LFYLGDILKSLLEIVAVFGNSSVILPEIRENVNVHGQTGELAPAGSRDGAAFVAWQRSLCGVGIMKSDLSDLKTDWPLGGIIITGFGSDWPAQQFGINLGVAPFIEFCRTGAFGN